MTERLSDEQLEAIAKDHECAWSAAIESMAAELLVLRADLNRVEPDSVLADLLNERTLSDALRAECVEAWRQYHLEKAKDGDAWKERALALRAERAKPTQSDQERTNEIAELVGIDTMDAHIIDLFMIEMSTTFASIRAEGSAERALEWAAGWHRVAETMCVIAGVSPALGADEMAAGFRVAWEDALAERAKLVAAIAAAFDALGGIDGQAALRDRILPLLAQPAESGATDEVERELEAAVNRGDLAKAINTKGETVYVSPLAGAKP